MLVQHSQRMPFRPGQCPKCIHFEAEFKRCRAFTTPSSPSPELAVLEGGSQHPCPRFEGGAVLNRAADSAGSAPSASPRAPEPEAAGPPFVASPAPGTNASRAMQCPQCGAQIEADSRFCRKCGARFEVSIRGYCPACRNMREANTEGKCGVCGTELYDRWPAFRPAEIRPVASRPAPVEPPTEPELRPAPAVRQGEPRIHCHKCKTENLPTVDRCLQCGANLLPAENVGTRIGYLIAGILGAALLGFLAYSLSSNRAAWQGPSICNPGVLFIAGLFVLVSGIAMAVRRTPHYVRYSARAQRHASLNLWQAVADLGRAIELAPKKERPGLLKQRVALYEKLGLREEATADLLAQAADPDAFKGEAALVGMLTGADSGIYAQSRSNGALKALVASGRVRAVGYCPRCKAAVALDDRRHCLRHPRTKGRAVQYVPPGQEEAGKQLALGAWEKQRRSLRRWLVVLILFLMLAVVCLLIPATAGPLTNLPFLKTPEPTATFRTTGGVATFADNVFTFDYPAGWSRMGPKEIRSLASGSLEGIGRYDPDYLGGVYTGGVNNCLGCAEIVAVVVPVDEMTGTLSVEQYERIRQAEEQQMGSRLLLHRLTSVGSLPAVESKFVGASRQGQQWQLIIVPKEPGKIYLFSCSSHKDSWDGFEPVCEQAIESLSVEGSGGTSRAPAAETVKPTTAPTPRPTSRPTARPTPRPTPRPTAAPVNGCPPNPAMVHIVNELGADLVLELSLDQTYHVSIPAGQVRNLCLPAGEYAYTVSAQGFKPQTGTRQLVAGVYRCWWWFKGEGGERECNAPADASAYSPP